MTTMYLLDTKTLKRVNFVNTGDLPPCTILSHSWRFREVCFQDLARPVSQYFKLPLFQKARKCCRLAKRHGLPYLWIDTCCIDQKSSAELSEAINFRNRTFLISQNFLNQGLSGPSSREFDSRFDFNCSFRSLPRMNFVIMEFMNKSMGLQENL